MSVLLPARGLQPQERDQLGFLWEGCRRGSHPRGERPSGSGTRAETQQSDRVEPAAGSAGRGLLCSQGLREGLCCCGLRSAVAPEGLPFTGPVSRPPCRPAPGHCGRRRSRGGQQPLAVSSASLPPSSACCSAPPWFRKPLTHLSAQVTKAFRSSQWLVLVVVTEYLLCVRWSDSGVE